MKWLPSVESTLVRRLIYPMIGAILICVCLNLFWSADGLFINLATELIGIVVTVFIVDRVISEHDDRKWRASRERTEMAIMRYANSLVTCVRSGLKIGIDVFPQWMFYCDNPVKVHMEFMNIAMNAIAPRAEEILDGLNCDEWRAFEGHLGQTIIMSNNLFSRYQSQITAAQLPILLDIERFIELFSFGLAAFPEVIGTVEEVTSRKFLPAMQQNLDLRSSAVADAARVVRSLLEKAVELSKTLSTSG